MRYSHPAFRGLVDRWARVRRPPYLFPGDKAVLGDRTVTLSGIDAFLGSSSFGQRKDSKFHIGLLPRPYTGDLRTAKVFILMLNAGLHAGDYFGEEHFADFRRAVRRNLDQNLDNEKFPMFLLNPQFAWHPGFQYWTRKFQGLLEAYFQKKMGSNENRVTKCQKTAAPCGVAALLAIITERSNGSSRLMRVRGA